MKIIFLKILALILIFQFSGNYFLFSSIPGKGNQQQNLIYKVQISSKYGSKADLSKLENKYNLDKPIEEVYHSGYYKYLAGTFVNYEDARQYRNYLITEKGIKDAFIIATQDGKIVEKWERINPSSGDVVEKPKEKPKEEKIIQPEETSEEEEQISDEVTDEEIEIAVNDSFPIDYGYISADIEIINKFPHLSKVKKEKKTYFKFGKSKSKAKKEKSDVKKNIGYVSVFAESSNADKVGISKQTKEKTPQKEEPPKSDKQPKPESTEEGATDQTTTEGDFTTDTSVNNTEISETDTSANDTFLSGEEFEEYPDVGEPTEAPKPAVKQKKKAKREAIQKEFRKQRPFPQNIIEPIIYVVETTFYSNRIIILAVILIFYFQISFALLVTFIVIARFIRSAQDQKKLLIKEKYQNIIADYLFSEENENLIPPELLKTRSKLATEVLIDEVLLLHNNLTGETYDRLIKL